MEFIGESFSNSKAVVMVDYEEYKRLKEIERAHKSGIFDDVDFVYQITGDISFLEGLEIEQRNKILEEMANNQFGIKVKKIYK